MTEKKFASVLIKCNDSVLLCKRSPWHVSRAGEWSIPSGMIERGETPIDAAARELWEETSITPNSPLNLIDIINTSNKDGDVKTGTMYIFLMESDKEISPDLTFANDGFEHTEWGYFKINNLPSPLGKDLKKNIQKLLKN